MDTTDRHIVQLLRAEGRISWAELGRKVGMSGPSVQDRVRRLEECGVITGFHAAVDPPAVGLGVGALVGIGCSDGAESEAVADHLYGVDEVEDCWFVAGADEFVVRVRAADMTALEKVVWRIRRLPGVVRTRTTVILSTRWENRPSPLPPEKVVNKEPVPPREVRPARLST